MNYSILGLLGLVVGTVVYICFRLHRAAKRYLLYSLYYLYTIFYLQNNETCTPIMLLKMSVYLLLYKYEF